MPFTPRPLLLSVFLSFSAAGAAGAEISAASGETAFATVGPGLGELGTVRVEAARLGGLEVNESGAADYRLSAEDIDRMPGGSSTPLATVLAQLPGVAIDANQQIHIRDTEGPQFQYQINGFLVPLDINTNPSLLSLLNALFVERLDLELGVLPARYGFSTGGIVELTTKDGCRAPGAAAFWSAARPATSSRRPTSAIAGVLPSAGASISACARTS